MPSIHDVRYFDSQMTGAPSVDGLVGAGKIMAIFDACLVDGFNVNSITSITVAGGVATATTSGNHNFRDYSVIRVWGATEAGLNGDWKSTVPGGNIFTWESAVADGVYSAGPISAKTAPLGWSKAFSAGNVAVYRAPAGLRHYFRLNDAHANHCYLRGYEAMTNSADAGTQPFPNSGQLASGVVIQRFTAGYKQRWQLVGDDKTVYFIFSPEDNEGVLTGSVHDYCINGFGEIASYMPSDLGSSFVAAGSSTGNTASHFNGLNYPGLPVGTSINNIYGGFYLSRPTSQVTGAPVRLRCGGNGLVSGWGSSFDQNGRTPSPNPADLADLFHYPVLVQEESSKSIRGEIRGLWQPLTTGSLANVGSTFEINGRKILLLRGPDASTYNIVTTARIGVVGVDVTGPW
jgi:hypothetical protein